MPTASSNIHSRKVYMRFVPRASTDNLPVFKEKNSLEKVVDETHFSKNEIRAIYRAFKETSPNAVINKSILREKFAELFPHGDIEHYSDLLFDTFDNDGNGTINFQASSDTLKNSALVIFCSFHLKSAAKCLEFVKALSILCRGTMDEKLDWLYKLYDPKDKGEVTWHRLFYVITSMDDLMGRRARPLLTREQRAQHAHNVFQKFDIGKRGRISKEDFFTVCKTDRQIIESMSSLYTILPG
ncbi:hypothetical protein Q1695_001478 [Nippostrongylus brasiliensis]|nr:hypothetical protein Q1695_001478 [Nippostrongylus brasiliensis]